MNITGIEVIRRNPGVAIGVVTGEKVGVAASPGEKLTVIAGDTVRVSLSVDYMGLAIDGSVWVAIGRQNLGFAEDFVPVAPVEVHFNQSFDWVTYPIVVDIPIWDRPGVNYDMYAKIMGVPGPDIFTDILLNIIDVLGIEIPGEYELVQHTIYPWSYIYEGDAEVCTFEFKLTPEQIPGTEWLGQRIVAAFVSELEKQGSRLLEVKVSRDISPPLWTNYLVEITASVSKGGIGSIGFAWAAVIILVLSILFIVGILFTIKAIDELIYKRKGLDEETKKTFSRETLVAMILDLEPETPPETLEAKSDQELRDLLNQILAEKAPPVSWWPLAIIGGLGVVGVGAAFALTGRRK